MTTEPFVDSTIDLPKFTDDEIKYVKFKSMSEILETGYSQGLIALGAANTLLFAVSILFFVFAKITTTDEVVKTCALVSSLFIAGVISCTLSYIFNHYFRTLVLQQAFHQVKLPVTYLFLGLNKLLTTLSVLGFGAGCIVWLTVLFELI